MENSVLEKSVSMLIEKAMSGVDTATSFLAAEIPDVVQQLLLWNMVKSGAACAFGLLLIVLWIIAEVKTFKICKEHDEKHRYDSWFEVYYLTIGSIVRLLLLAVVYYSINLTWLQIWIAPKVWLIEYAAKMMK